MKKSSLIRAPQSTPFVFNVYVASTPALKLNVNNAAYPCIAAPAIPATTPSKAISAAITEAKTWNLGCAIKAATRTIFGGLQIFSMAMPQARPQLSRPPMSPPIAKFGVKEEIKEMKEGLKLLWQFYNSRKKEEVETWWWALYKKLRYRLWLMLLATRFFRWRVEKAAAKRGLNCAERRNEDEEAIRWPKKGDSYWPLVLAILSVAGKAALTCIIAVLKTAFYYTSFNIIDYHLSFFSAPEMNAMREELKGLGIMTDEELCDLLRVLNAVERMLNTFSQILSPIPFKGLKQMRNAALALKTLLSLYVAGKVFFLYAFEPDYGENFRTIFGWPLAPAVDAARQRLMAFIEGRRSSPELAPPPGVVGEGLPPRIVRYYQNKINTLAEYVIGWDYQFIGTGFDGDLLGYTSAPKNKAKVEQLAGTYDMMANHFLRIHNSYQRFVRVLSAKLGKKALQAAQKSLDKAIRAAAKDFTAWGTFVALGRALVETSEDGKNADSDGTSSSNAGDESNE